MSILSNNIRAIREKLGFTQESFANAIGITAAAVSHWESDKREPDIEMIIKIADLGQVTLDWLMRNETETRIYFTPSQKTSRVKEPHYIPIEKAEKNDVIGIINYKILAMVPAGNAEIKDFQSADYDDLYYDPRTHFYLRIDDEYGYSMNPFLQPGDLVLINAKAKVFPGDLVAARWDKTKGAIKIFGEVEGKKDLIVLNSYNASEKPIVLSKEDVTVYKIILIKKKK